MADYNDYKGMTPDEILESLDPQTRAAYEELRRRRAAEKPDHDGYRNLIVEVVNEYGIDFFELQPVATAMSAALKRSRSTDDGPGTFDVLGEWGTCEFQQPVSPKVIREKLGLNSREHWIYRDAVTSHAVIGRSATLDDRMRFAHENYQKISKWFTTTNGVNWKLVASRVREAVGEKA